MRFGPTLEGLQNHGSSTKTGCALFALAIPAASAGLSWILSAFRNQIIDLVDDPALAAADIGIGS
jgi:hypothetical protein